MHRSVGQGVGDDFAVDDLGADRQVARNAAFLAPGEEEAADDAPVVSPAGSAPGGGVAERSKAADCKSADVSLRRFESFPLHQAPRGAVAGGSAGWVVKRTEGCARRHNPAEERWTEADGSAGVA